MNVIIVGCGRTGSRLARSLADARNHVNVVDTNRHAADSIPRALLDSGAVRIIEGDGTLSETLNEADIDEADAVFALTGKDTLNGLAALKAKLVFRVMTVVAAIKDPDACNVYESLGVMCVNPSALLEGEILAAVPQLTPQTPPGAEE